MGHFLSYHCSEIPSTPETFSVTQDYGDGNDNIIHLGARGEMMIKK